MSRELDPEIACRRRSNGKEREKEEHERRRERSQLPIARLAFNPEELLD